MALHHDSLLSSPDPLGLSLNSKPTSSPAKSPQKPGTPRKALSESHGNTQAQHFYLNTPSAPHTPSKSSAKSAQDIRSPWRIRVTVEAEPEINMVKSPSKHLAERTTTTSVPLKAADDSSPAAVKRGRGRPRKSLEGPIKRNGTPKPRATGRKKILHGISEQESEDEAAEPLSSPKRRRGRPRKSIGSSAAKPESESFNAEEVAEASQGDESAGLEMRTKSKGRRKAMTPTRKRAAPDTSTPTTPVDDAFSFTGPMTHSSTARSAESEVSAHERRPNKRRSLGKKEETSDDGLLEETHSLDAGHSQIEEQDVSTQQAALAKADENMWRSMIRQDSFSPADETDNVGIGSEENEYNQQETGDDPTDDHQEFDSILESEGFSMVSISSLPSAQQQSGSSESHQANEVLTRSKLISSPQDASASVKPANTSQLRTPSLASSTSSSMPPPPIPSARNQASQLSLPKSADGTPKLVRIVRAGIALQGALSPANSDVQPALSASTSDLTLLSSSSMSSKDSSQHLFDGFGAGTRRELRAGLRLGEELAKRQQRDQDEMKFGEKGEDDVFGQDVEPAYPRLPLTKESHAYSLKMPGAEQKILYPALQNPQLPSPAGSAVGDEDKMSWKADSPMLNEPALSSAERPSGQETPDQPTPLQGTPLEVRWQREREDVIRQIEEANTSQVMVIDSDDEDDAGPEDGDEDDRDIWQEEAKSSKPTHDSSEQIANELLPTEPPKPRRSKLPRTWRRDNPMLYSDEVEHTEQDVVAEPKKEAKKAIEKGQVAKQNLRQKQKSPLPSTPTENVPTASAPARRRVRIDGEHHPVERPGWKPVKGRLQTPAKKTLRNVLAQQYEDEPAENFNDEDEGYSENDQERSTNFASDSSTGLNQSLTDQHDCSVNDDIEEKVDTSVAGEESLESDQSIEYEESLKDEPEIDLTKGTAAVSRTPPGSPPQHLFASLYIPPAPAQPTSTSWLGHLTSYIPTIRTPASTPVPNAESLDPAHWNLHPFPPLYTHLPLDSTHIRVFRPYFEAQMANPDTYPFNPYSPAAKLLNTPLWARNNYGWVRYLSKSDLGLVDKFMEVLRVKGVERRPGLYFTGDQRRIEELDVAKTLFDSWQDGVMHGTCRVEWEIGNRVGNVPRTTIPVTPGKIKGPRRWKKEVFLLP
ncbi:MAG: hypothetical protein HETSPECPRED_008343 [Heterodermia speciosa]|uniref:Uncharacterized protein n=1 Tax=Heterodermia speciosa TaxID=116794 RepID=A0A8H3ILF6_9LECA|nr:MAG: hypothetical protein HETSPECPRED_008343 [Heterodermia speciosa]